MKLTPNQLRTLGYDPSQSGPILQRAIPALPKPDSTHLSPSNHVHIPPTSLKAPVLSWVDYHIKSLNRTRYQHWTIARKHVVEAKEAWQDTLRTRYIWTSDNVTLIHIISFRSRFLDLDNLIGGAKGLRDAIAESLGVDDSEQFIQWNYHQIIAKPYGTLVVFHQFPIQQKPQKQKSKK